MTFTDGTLFWFSIGDKVAMKGWPNSPIGTVIRRNSYQGDYHRAEVGLRNIEVRWPEPHKVAVHQERQLVRMELLKVKRWFMNHGSLMMMIQVDLVGGITLYQQEAGKWDMLKKLREVTKSKWLTRRTAEGMEKSSWMARSLDDKHQYWGRDEKEVLTKAVIGECKLAKETADAS